MLVAGEAAHWDRDDSRARVLVTRARGLIRKYERPSKYDHDVLFRLSGDEEEANSDLAGTWTLGVR